MKVYSILVVLLSISLGTFAQSYPVPATDLQDVSGNTFNTSNITNDGKPVIISFWATWCKPCIQELTSIAEVYADWQEETGVKLVAISIDDTRNLANVGPFANGRGWEYEVYCDPNGDFKRLLNVNTVPHTFLVDGSGNIVWQHNSYQLGDEDELYELVKKLAAGETLTAE